MKIAFVEAEPGEQKFFQRAFPGHTVMFESSLEDVERNCEVVSSFIFSRIDAAFLESHPRVNLVATRSTTYDHISLEECKARGVLVSYVPTYGDYTVAEHTMALILAMARRLREAFEMRLEKRFSYEAIRGWELRGKTLGIVGAGRIGMNVIRMARGFEMEVVAYDVHPQSEAAARLGFQYVPFEKLLRTSHIISLHAPLTPASRHMLNRDTFGKCRRGVLIVNTARGGLIDTGALIQALDAGIVGGAALDVLEQECLLRAEAEEVISDQILKHLLASSATSSKATSRERISELQSFMRNGSLLSRKHVIFTPHCGFNTVEAVDQINRTTVANIRAYISGKPTNLAGEKC
ncbi:MAG: NAD(P)-dependent oxidoreductase [Verrucomicrobiota bacterium]